MLTNCHKKPNTKQLCQDKNRAVASRRKYDDVLNKWIKRTICRIEAFDSKGEWPGLCPIVVPLPKSGNLLFPDRETS